MILALLVSGQGATAHAIAQGLLGLWDSPPSPPVADALAGLDDLHGFRFADAERRFRSLTTALPEHPIGYVMLADLAWWSYLNDRSRTGARERIEAATERAIDVARERLDDDPDNPELLFLLSQAYGRRAMFVGSDGRGFRAAADARRSFAYADRAARSMKEPADARMIRGIFQVAISQASALIRAGAEVVFRVNVDRAAGMQALETAGRSGVFTRFEAALYLAIVHLRYGDPSIGRRIIDPLSERYPGNPHVALLAAYARQRLGAFAAACAGYERALTLDAMGAELTSLTRFLFGQALFGLGDLDGARDAFLSVLDSSAEDAIVRPHAMLYLGRIADVEGDRPRAVGHYEDALRAKDADHAHATAKRLLLTPFSAAEIPALVRRDPR